MLSRFTKLPGVSSLFQSNVNYPAEEIDAAITKIKKLGRYSNNNDAQLQGITIILSLMRKYSESLHVQRVSCHAISNLAMQVSVARWIVQKGGFALVKKALLRFESDHKLCWLGSSAVWNLARPPVNRGIIGKQGVQLMLQMLKIHFKKEKVTNTAIGALSNLSLCDNLKDIIAEKENIELIMSVLNNYNKTSLSVATSGAGLIANLAVSDDHAHSLVEKGAISLLLTLLQWDKSIKSDETLFRNSCAALNNMVTADNFIDYFLKECGIEVIYKFLKTNEVDQYNTLLENCLVNIEVDINEETTSFHLCALHQKIDIFKQLLENNPDFDLNEKDSKNMTCLDYAIMNKNSNMCQFLAKCGATKYQPNLLKDIKDNNENNKNQQEEMETAMNCGTKILHDTIFVHQQTVSEALPKFPTDLCKLMITFQSNIDMLQSIKQYA